MYQDVYLRCLMIYTRWFYLSWGNDSIFYMKLDLNSTPKPNPELWIELELGIALRFNFLYCRTYLTAWVN